ncbi:MAG: 2Fe-2S iron-sulfur cluster binding domain-containing protein [Proteobacteria bacterium]|nr:2Fe-2S iron-sulfur cluster binding domain-containing protein [Pseudomonadota bacterium]
MSESAGYHRVTIAETGESFQCSDTESALSALARSGKRGIPVGCRGGGCGVCKVAILSGDFRKRAMSRSHITEEDEARHHVLACCIYPQSDIQVHVIGKLQKAIHR